VYRALYSYFQSWVIFIIIIIIIIIIITTITLFYFCQTPTTDEQFHITAMFVTVDIKPIFFLFSVGMHIINLQTKLHPPSSTTSSVTADVPKTKENFRASLRTYFAICKNITFSKATYFYKPYYHTFHMFW